MRNDQIFISFVHGDQRVAAAVQTLIREELKLEGSVFLSSDQALVLAGDPWLEKIRGARAVGRMHSGNQAKSVAGADRTNPFARQ